ncbi:MAG: OmpA family protein, partial [Oscillospiraceae bacterium]|nr:OmpA family protein [Oscillospiraceae bacterium]
LYQYLSEYVDENDLADQIAVEQGSAYITITFDDDVFFEPNSYVLKDEGREVLNGIGVGLKAAQSFIKSCSVTGHTAKAISAANDWELSSLRACSVVNFMEYRVFLPSDKFRTRGYGCTEPIADNTTAEGRAKNRRVELFIVENKAESEYTAKEMQDIWEHDYGLSSSQIDPEGNRNNDESKLPNGAAQTIINNIQERFPESDSSSIGYEGPIAFSDYSSFLVAANSSPSNAGGDEDGGDNADSE